MSQSAVKTGQLWSKNKDELTKQLTELKTELSQLRIQKIVSSGTKLNKMYVNRAKPTKRKRQKTPSLHPEWPLPPTARTTVERRHGRRQVASG